MSRLKNKVAIVTGASKGIGRGVAIALADEGANVVVNFKSSAEDAEKVVNIIETKGGKAIAIQADVSKKEEVQHLFYETKKVFGSVDILVNNAGVYTFGPLEMVTEESFEIEMKVNVLGPILTIQEAMPHFEENGGSIINISSVAALRPTPMTMLYTATKGALNSITEVLSKELGAKKIRINSISPGLVETEGTHRIGTIGSESEQYMVANTPLGRVGQPEDIAKVAVFLASDEAQWVTGQNIAAAGGF